MTLGDLGRALRRGRLIIVACVVAGLGAAGAYTLVQTPEYVAESQLFLEATDASDTQSSRQDTIYLQQRMQSYAAVLGSPALGDRVAGDLGLDLTGAEVAARMTVEVPAETVLLNVSVRDSSAERAQLIANTVGDEFARLLSELEGTQAAAIDAVDVTTIRPAPLPGSPAAPDAVLLVLSGLLLGLVVGAGLALLREGTDDTVRGADGVRRLGLTSLAEVPRRGRSGELSPARRDALRRVRLHLDAADAGARVLAVTAPAAGPDVAAFAGDLAVVLAASGRRVLLVDAHGQAARLLGVDGDGAGLAEVLAGSADLSTAVRSGPGGLGVLPGGRSDVPDALSPARAREVLDKLAAGSDVVVVAAPPLDGPPDAEALALAASDVLLVVGDGGTRERDLQRALRTLEDLRVPVLGAALEEPARGRR
ncbi:Wzz/FepE/Etk N-terminal domain-containing protein [Geodermatophilus sp. SYSU D01176]